MKQEKTNKSENFTPTLFTDIFDNAKFFGKNWLEKEFGQSLPAVNIKETNKDFNLEFAAPGFKKNDFKVSVDHNVLNIRAEKEEEKKEENKRFTRKEFSYNSFSRSFTLPESVNAEKIDAKYEEGILKLSVPKLVETKSLPKKEIKVV
ncbi:MAG: Hsp20/alpha crystallin family protein [Bacteroidota bacterium]